MVVVGDDTGGGGRVCWCWWWGEINKMKDVLGFFLRYETNFWCTRIPFPLFFISCHV
ncbi:hypothetical protein Hanom_Chr17g01524101 [Helianthus anomalus]